MSDWRSLGWQSGRLISAPTLVRQGLNANGREGYLPLEHLTNPLKLYLRNTQTNGITSGGVNCYDLLTTAGASNDTAVVTATASGTDIQWTKTAGGSILVFTTGRAPVGGWTIIHADLALWAFESVATVNAGLRVRFYKRDTGGTETLIGGSPFDDGVELSTDNTLMEWAGNVTDTALAEDERLLVKFYLTNVGTMAAGTATINFNGDSTSGSSPSVSYIGTASYTESGSTSTATAAGIGTASSTRRVIATVAQTTASGRTLTSATIGGISATIHQQSTDSGSTSGAYIISAVVPTGTTADIVLTFSDTLFGGGSGAIYTVDDTTVSSTVGGGTNTTTSATSLAVNYTSTTDGFSVGITDWGNGSGKTPITVTGYTVDFSDEGQYAAFRKNETASGSATATTAWSGSFGAASAVASFAPASTTVYGNSYINVYPTVAFKAEGGGPTVIDLTTAGLTFTKQNPQLKATAGLSVRSFTFTGQALQTKLNIAQTTASLLYSAKTTQLKVNSNLNAATLSFSAKAVQLKNTVVQAAASLLYSAKTVQLKVNNNLTAAALNFSAQIVNAFNSGGAIVVDLAAAAFGFVSHTVQTKVTAPLSLAALSLTAQAVQLRAAVGLTLANLLTSAKTVQTRLVVALTAAQNSLTAQLIGARLTLSVTVANTLRFISSAVQLRSIVSLIKANFYFLPLVVDVVGEGVAAIVVRFRYSMTRFRQILKSRKY